MRCSARPLRRELDHLGERVRWLERRDDAFEPRAELERLQRLLVRRRKIGDAADVVQPCMLRSDARIVEPAEIEWPSRIWPSVVHEDIGAVAVEDAGLPARDRGCAPAVRLIRSPWPAASTPTPLDRTSRRRGTDEQADGVRAAADGGDEAVGQAAGRRSRICARASLPMTDWNVAHHGGERMRPRAVPMQIDVSATLVTQSRSASFIASFSVRPPACTGRTSAPSNFMRKTFGFCRSTSTSPHETMHCRPKQAQAVAVATPCWPAPVSAMMRCLPMRGEQDLAEHVVDLVRAGMVEAVALEIDLRAVEPLGQPLGEIERARSPD